MANSPRSGVHEEDLTQANSEQIYSALFINLVIQVSNMGLVLLGKMPNPETGDHELDIDGAKVYIDQLEMLAVKTEGNLNEEEKSLVTRSLNVLRMSFVDVMDNQKESTADL